jgi:hypothetical protein
MVDTRDLLLQRTSSTDLYQFDIFVNLKSAEESHFYCHGLTAADFASVFRRDLAGCTVYISRFSPGLLNSSYWETHTAANEQEVRAKSGGAIIKEEGGARYLWRSDHVPRGRKLRDGVGVDPELVQGNVLSVPGSEFQKIADALQAHKVDVRFVVVESGDNHHLELARRAAEDTRALRRSQKNEKIVYSSRGNYITQIVFSEPELLLKGLEAAIRGFSHRISGRHVAHINHSVLKDLASHLDKAGAVCYAHRDFVVKDTHLEMTLHLGKSEWPPEIEQSWDDRRILVYYDRTAGIWAHQM